jgi:Fur family ferric uptake transcriptional regulator
MGPRVVETDPRARLQAAGLRVTASRIAVMELLAVSEAPMTHQEVAQHLGDSTWNRSTLYRNLIDLTDAGLLRKTVIAGLMRFEPANRHGGCSDHAHFVCSECGDVTHLEGVAIEVVGHGGPRAIATGDVEVQLRGRCDPCAERLAPSH